MGFYFVNKIISYFWNNITLVVTLSLGNGTEIPAGIILLNTVKHCLVSTCVHINKSKQEITY